MRGPVSVGQKANLDTTGCATQQLSCIRVVFCGPSDRATKFAKITPKKDWKFLNTFDTKDISKKAGLANNKN